MQVLKNVMLVGAAVFMPAVAFAADLAPKPVEPVPVIVEPSFTWTGFYVGANAGYGRGPLDTDLRSVPPNVGGGLGGAIGISAGGGVQKVKDTAGGFIAGGQLGYNYQFDPNWVVGAEADLQYAGIDTTTHIAGANNTIITLKTKVDWYGTARVRAGYAYDRFLIYATGGLAYGNVKSKLSVPTESMSGSDTNVGWAAGAGVEYALTQNWTLRGEYLYVDLGKATTINKESANGQARITAKPDVALHTVRAAVNYKF